MSDEQDKALQDMLAYGTGVIMDGKHVPLDQCLLDDYIVLFGNNDLPPEKLAALERMEQAIRADEREKAYLSGYEAGVEKAAAFFETPEAAERLKQGLMPIIDAARAATIEECAKVAENYSNAEPGDICEVMAGDWQHGIAASIRAKIGDRNG